MTDIEGKIESALEGYALDIAQRFEGPSHRFIRGVMNTSDEMLGTSLYYDFKKDDRDKWTIRLMNRSKEGDIEMYLLGEGQGIDYHETRKYYGETCFQSEGNVAAESHKKGFYLPFKEVLEEGILLGINERDDMEIFDSLGDKKEDIKENYSKYASKILSEDYLKSNNLEDLEKKDLGWFIKSQISRKRE